MHKAIFLEGDLRKHLFNLALPAIISLIANFGFMLADTYFVAQLGTVPLTAISFTFPVFELVIGLGVGLGVATIACVGQSLGAHKYDLAKRYTTAALVAGLLFGLLILVAGLTHIAPLFRLLGAHNDTLPYIAAFMHVWFCGIPLVMVFFIFSFALRAYGYAKTVAILGISAALLNLAIDPFLIFGWWIFPKLGIAGAAWAGLISRLFTASVALVIMKRKHILLFYFDIKRYWWYWSRLLKVMIPATLTNLVPPLSVTITTYLLSTLSQEAVAAYGIASKIQWIAVIPLLALSGSLSPVVAQNFGARNFHRCLEALDHTAIFSVLWGVLMAGLLALLAPTISGWFTKDTYILTMSNHFLYIVPISFIGWGIIMMVSATFNATKKPKYSAMISILRMLVVYIPLALLFMHYWGYNGIFASLTIANISVAAIGWVLVRFIFRKERRLPKYPV